MVSMQCLHCTSSSEIPCEQSKPRSWCLFGPLPTGPILCASETLATFPSSPLGVASTLQARKKAGNTTAASRILVVMGISVCCSMFALASCDVLRTRAGIATGGDVAPRCSHPDLQPVVVYADAEVNSTSAGRFSFAPELPLLAWTPSSPLAGAHAASPVR